jgi:hypothetical protein
MSLFSLAGASRAHLTFADLLRIEDSTEILDFRCRDTEIPIWPQVRIAFFRMIMADLLFSAAASMDVPMRRDRVRMARTLARSLAHNAGMRVGGRLRSDVLINTEAIGDQWVDGKWYNRYVDPFGDLPTGDQALVLTDLFEWNWHTPRHNPRSYIHAPIQAAMSLRARAQTGGAARRQAEAMTAYLCERAETLIGWQLDEGRRAQFVARATARIATCAPRYAAYARLLRQVRPRLLLGSSHCYGFHATLVAAARDAGVLTAEYQHGSISEGHDAYNFAPAIAASDAYRRTLPEYLLTYGDWWGEHIDVPVEKIAIGYPAREMKLAGTPPPPGERKQILLLSDSVEFDLYLELAQAIDAAVHSAGFEVVIRPHPMERSAVREKWGEKVGRVAIDQRADIYTAFHSAHSVISEMSTGMFEAIGLVDQVLILDTPKARFTYPSHPFALVGSAEDAADVILGRRSGRPTDVPERFWAPNWQERYNLFLGEKVGLK